ncbi:riboflavin kinase-domain-containing protein [Bipolaris maydis]|uniref:riboflavin kinase-domain-containing protein n=1 Tax=Cochliobolus heterostrophus TaxID=5016 RepID=UPI0024D32C07|nr:riboflavin kinase-domain-containing protein [Bipolaris maydis]KAJ5063434.1 riboflavin kinase-domain-containing protein [Bipolaris maydis]KAJ6272821.1 riboflavin kinase-domain-containing protein [Bipolaris maydis]
MGRPDGPRDPIAGPDAPQPPFPLKLRGPLGIPTANIPLSGLSIGGNEDLDSGIYYGWCTLDPSTIPPPSSSSPSSSTSNTTRSDTTSTDPPPSTSSNHAVLDLNYPTDPAPSPQTIYPTVLSVGYNPYYKNSKRSIEIHILHNFERDFYGATLSLVILGFIRPEYDYVSLEALVEDIREDIRVAKRSLEREKYLEWKGDEWLKGKGEGGEVMGNGDERVEQAGQKDEVVKSEMMN